MLTLLFASIGNSETSVVANGLPNDTVISQSEIIKIFTRKRLFWDNGHRITVFIKPVNSVEHKVFAINILHITPFKYKTLLDTITYTGSNSPAVEIQSDEEMISRLSRTPFSVGYLNYNTVVINSNNSDLIYIKIEQ